MFAPACAVAGPGLTMLRSACLEMAVFRTLDWIATAGSPIEPVAWFDSVRSQVVFSGQVRTVIEKVVTSGKGPAVRLQVTVPFAPTGGVTHVQFGRLTSRETNRRGAGRISVTLAI